MQLYTTNVILSTWNSDIGMSSHFIMLRQDLDNIS